MNNDGKKTRRGKHKRYPILDPYNKEILEYIKMELSTSAIHKIINHELQKDGKKISYAGLRLHILRIIS